MTQHQAFLTRPHYRLYTCVNADLQALKQQARGFRQAGYYNIATLWVFRQCWRISGTIDDYIHYLAFRRDLGYPLTALQHQRLQRWPQTLWQQLFWPLRQRHANRLRRRLLNPVNTGQAELHHRFQHFLQQHTHVQIVGNSANLLHQDHGNAIDLAPVVVRFNRCFSDATNVSDTGQKTDIWVCAPDFKHPAIVSQWCILTGPDMLEWLPHPPHSLSAQANMLSVPLSIWRKLVGTLGAPPSAGILVLAWLTQLAPNVPRFVLGFNHTNTGEQYHIADPTHQAVTRHNWTAETQLLRQWQRLNVITVGTKETAN